MTPGAASARRMRAIHVPPRVVIDNRAIQQLHRAGSERPRPPGPAARRDLRDQRTRACRSARAHVSTYGVRAVDVFYVKDVFGLKVENERKLATLREALLAALSPAGEVEAPIVPPPTRPKRADAA